MYCLDWGEDVEDMLIYGNGNVDNYQMFAVNLFPCNLNHTGEELISLECLGD